MNHTISECWEEGGGNHANTPIWVKKSGGDKSKKKKERDKAYLSKDDSGSETAAFVFNTTKPGCTDELLTSLSGHLEDRHVLPCM